MRPSARDSNSSRRENSEKKSTAALQMVLADQRLWKHIQKNSRLKSETTGQLAQNSSARKTQIENEEEEEEGYTVWTKTDLLLY